MPFPDESIGCGAENKHKRRFAIFHMPYSTLFSMAWISSSQRAALASEGIIHPPRGERLSPTICGPSVLAERLNCWLKKRL